MKKTTCVLAFASIFIVPVFAQTRWAATIAGQVSAEGKHQSAVQARVRLLRFGAVMEEKSTAGSGLFQFGVSAAGSYTLEVEAPGFETVTMDASPLESDEGVYLFIDLRRPRQSQAAASKTISVAEYAIPRSARREFDRARVQQGRSNCCAAALAHFQKAIEAHSEYAAAHNEMGNCYVLLGDFGRAEESFARAIGLASTVYPSMNLADMYVQQGRFNDARRVLQAAIRSNPGEGDAYYSLALAYFEQGCLDEAEKAAFDADSRVHRMADVHLLLARIYAQRHDVPAVVGQLQIYLTEAPAGQRREAIRRELNNYSLLPK